MNGTSVADGKLLPSAGPVMARVVPVSRCSATTPLADQLGAMEDLRQEGKIESIGISNASVAQAESALELVELGEVQNAYSIVLRENEDTLRLRTERGIAFVSYFPLGSAFTRRPEGDRGRSRDQQGCREARCHSTTTTSPLEDVKQAKNPMQVIAEQS